MWKLVSCFGSPFAGQICDDGPVRCLGTFDELQKAKDALRSFCDRQRCLVVMRPDGMAAGFSNWNDSPTGWVEIRKVDGDLIGEAVADAAATTYRALLEDQS